uniref:F-box domain-containing protein n=1 Tax=Clastoptera arizonana TaxID=38151 RepID=A0A1B6DGI8_9HEMI
MDNIGHFISHEYGIIKHILEYLPAKSLLAAKQVCRAWAEVTNVILAEKNKIIWIYTSDIFLCPPNQQNTLQTIPKAIISNCNDGGRNVNPFWPHADCRNLKFCPCRNGENNTYHVMVRGHENALFQWNILNEGYDFLSHSCITLMLPAFPGVEIINIVYSRQNKIFNTARRNFCYWRRRIC